MTTVFAFATFNYMLTEFIEAKLKSVPHIFFWYGNASVVIAETVTAWREAFAKKYGLENFVAVASDDLKGEDGAGKLHAAVASQSLFSSKRLVILRLTEKLDKAVAEALARLLETVGADTTLVIWYEGSPDERMGWFKTAHAQAKTGVAAVKAFWVQGSKEITKCRDVMTLVDPAQFVRQVWAKRNVLSEPRLGEYLVERVGIDLWQLKNEADKCASYVGATGAVTKEVVALLSVARIEEDIFALVDAVGTGRWVAALKELEEHLLQDHEPLHLLSMIARQVRLLVDMHIFSGEVPGLHPFVARKMKAQAERYRREDLERLLELVLQLELKLKTTSLPPSALLTKFLYESVQK